MPIFLNHFKFKIGETQTESKSNSNSEMIRWERKIPPPTSSLSEVENYCPISLRKRLNVWICMSVIVLYVAFVFLPSLTIWSLKIVCARPGPCKANWSYRFAATNICIIHWEVKSTVEIVRIRRRRIFEIDADSKRKGNVSVPLVGCFLCHRSGWITKKVSGFFRCNMYLLANWIQTAAQQWCREFEAVMDWNRSGWTIFFVLFMTLWDLRHTEMYIHIWRVSRVESDV